MQDTLEGFQRRKQSGGNCFSGEVPDHRAQFVFGVETQAVVDQVELAGAFLEQDVTCPCGRHC